MPHVREGDLMMKNKAMWVGVFVGAVQGLAYKLNGQFDAYGALILLVISLGFAMQLIKGANDDES